MTDANNSSCENRSSPVASELSSSSSSSSIGTNVHTPVIQREISTFTNQQSQILLSSELSSSSESSSSKVRPLSSIQISLIAGSCAGITSTIGVYPMDVLRTKMQQQVQGQTNKPQLVHGPFEIFRTTIQKKNGGIRALYTGITMPLLAQTIYKSTVFTISNITQQYLVTNRMNSNNNRDTSNIDYTKPTLLDQFVGGFIGGGCNAALFVTPVEFIRNQLIAQNTILSTETTTSTNTIQKITTLDVVKNSFRHSNGIFVLWRGISWTIYRDSLGCGCFFYTMAYCQQQQQSLTIFKKDETTAVGPPSIITTIVSSGIAGLAYWIVALPLDTIKTWVQSADISTTTSTTKNIKLFSVSTTIRTIYNQYGIYEVFTQLFRGWQFAYFRGIPSAAITMTTYSIMYRYLSNNGYDTFTS